MFMTGAPNGVAMASPVMNMGSSVTSVTAGSNQTCAIKSSTLYCWGDNTYGEVGTGTLGNQYATPQVVSLTNPGVINAVSAGGYHTCLLYAGGTVLCWGENNSGELGLGYFTSAAPYGVGTAAAVVGSVSGIALDMGDSHSCALNGNSTISCWGNDTSGQLGNGSIVSPGIDMAVTMSASSLPFAPTAVSAGGFQTCALLKNGSMSCWGSNSSGELGNGNEAQSSAPTQVLATW
jgi:alpha-tubulin suppressor-like RCC1 family protein